MQIHQILVEISYYKLSFFDLKKIFFDQSNIQNQAIKDIIIFLLFAYFFELSKAQKQQIAIIQQMINIQQEADLKNNNLDPILALKQQKINQPQSIKTEQTKLQAYLQFTSLQGLQSILKIQKTFLEQLPSDIEYDQSQFFKKVIVKITKNSLNLQFIDLQVRFGYFIFKNISLVNIEGTSSTHTIVNNDSGNFCTVYLCKHKENPLAFKCFSKIKLSYLLKEGNILERVIQEYCILKLASIMKVGPKMSKIFGFDIMIYPKCIQFCMQGCQPFPQRYISIINKIKDDLTDNLIKLHSSRIIHHDIKMENICFSKAYNKFVFIDFGMGRLLQQRLGFKTYTLFKGSLNHCSEEMVELNKQVSYNEKPIDLYFNDLTALKKTLQQLKTEEFQYDCDLINKERKLKVIQKTNEIHHINFVKYNLFQQKEQVFFKMLEKLPKNQTKYIFQWTINLKKSSEMKRICNRLFFLMKIQHKKSFQYLWKNEQVQEKTKQKVQVQTLCQLNQINKYSKYHYFINQFHNNLFELYNLLKNSQKVQQLKLEQYEFLLARAIQINGSDLSLQKIQIICKIYEQSYPQQLKNSQISKQLTQYFYRISLLLFKKAFLNKLKGRHLQVFQYTINNIFLYELLSDQEIIHYYQKILSCQFIFNVKVKVLIQFLSAFYWFYFTSINLDRYFLLMKLIEDKNALWIEKSNYNQEQVSILKAILLKEQFYLNLEALQKNIYYNIPEVRVWLNCIKISNVPLDQQVYEQLQKFYYQSSPFSNSLLEYYHFFLIFAYFIDKNVTKIEQLISKFEKILRKKENTLFLVIIKNITLLIKTDFKDISKFIKQMLAFSECQHTIINYKMLSTLRFITIYYSKQFQKLSLQTKKEYFQLIIKLTTNRTLRINKSFNLQRRCQAAVKQIFHLFQIQNKYQQYFKEKIKLITDKRQLYRRIKDQLSHNLTTIKDINYFMIISCWILIITLKKSNKYQEALKLVIYLYKISHYTSSALVNPKSILQYTFYEIIDQMHLSYKTKRDNYRELYFDYAKIIQSNKRQQQYLKNFPFFVDVLDIMYKYRPQLISAIINKTSKKLFIFNNKRYVQNYISTFNHIFYMHSKNKQFFNINYAMQQHISAKENPYNVILLFFIHSKKPFELTTKHHFFNIFSSLPEIHIIARQFILKKLFFFYLIYFLTNLKFRNIMWLNRNIIKYNLKTFSVKQLMKLFIYSKTLKILGSSQHLKKKKCIREKFARFRSCIQYSLSNALTYGGITYGRIYIYFR